MNRKLNIKLSICSVFFTIMANVLVYEKLRACVRGFSEGKSEASKQSN